MSSQFKPTRPTGGPIKNPRNTRIAGFEALLEELNKQTASSARTGSMKDVTNSARRTSKSDDASKSKQPRSAREIPTYVQGNFTAPKDLSNIKVPKAPSNPQMIKDAFEKEDPSAHGTTSNRGLTPSAALQKYSGSLTDFEKVEIHDFDEVFYVGMGARKSSRSPNGANHGHDDSKGDYKVVMDDHIAYRYQVVSELGRGSFGQVSKALDHKSGQYVALKIIKNKKKFHDQALVEVKILKHLNDSDPHDRCHNIRMLNSFLFRNHMVIIFQIHGMNLYEMCKAQRFAPCSMSLMKNFAKQLLLCLNNNAKEKIVHCDLKPENILLKMNSKSQLAVIDYGSACYESQRLYTYIQSRFYRAPEVMLGIPYTTQIDVWSLGCILAELANGYPLFPGESEVEQMQCLLEVLGMPPKALLDKSPRKKIFFDSTGAPRLTPNSRGRVRKPNTKDLRTFLKTSDDSFIDFIKALLTYDPEKRLSPMQAMQHPWLLDSAEKSDFTSSTPRGLSSTNLSTGNNNFARQLAKQSAPAIGTGTGLLPMLPKRQHHW